MNLYLFRRMDNEVTLAVMSIETCEVFSGKLVLYELLEEGEEAIRQGRKLPLADAMAQVRKNWKTPK